MHPVSPAPPVGGYGHDSRYAPHVPRRRRKRRHSAERFLIARKRRCDRANECRRSASSPGRCAPLGLVPAESVRVLTVRPPHRPGKDAERLGFPDSFRTPQGPEASWEGAHWQNGDTRSRESESASRPIPGVTDGPQPRLFGRTATSGGLRRSGARSRAQESFGRTATFSARFLGRTATPGHRPTPPRRPQSLDSADSSAPPDRNRSDSDARI